MLTSMTGFGQAREERDGLNCSVEVRSVNNRFLKVVSKLPDSHGSLELDIEKAVKEKIGRGTVYITFHLRRLACESTYQINTEVLRVYLGQLADLGVDRSQIVGSLLTLPGVVNEPTEEKDPQQDWALMSETLRQALERLLNMRRDEGAAMHRELQDASGRVAGELDAIGEHATRTAEAYRNRLLERVGNLLKDRGVTVAESDLIREVSIFADRADITEEVTRLKSHLRQFDEIMRSQANVGRKLEFVVQEMHREANTIGSKANDIAISRRVVEMKNEIERIREIIQNVE
ncbi:Conserved hypothetical protein CHP00255 [Planctomycetes bacterium Pan216]|uniref:YicC-like family, N-terminal region n=1 Tax=Kolteria novifilia TaxID=2527975 RepID=A0A518B114_9BACT|nr:Conserved hypothetical protein CHP00255 [Planctomycetes bacterium Pan216]